MRILVISAEVWRDDTNGGNVLSNIFGDMEAEFAQIYCNPGMPSNHLCKRYYQMTDASVLRNLLKKEPVGKCFVLEDEKTKEGHSEIQIQQIKGYSAFKAIRLPLFFVLQELMWLVSDWKSKELKQFVEEFAPDVIFAPCYASQRMLAMVRHIKKLTNKPIISYISDDNYSLRQFHISPVYWLNRFVLRHDMRKTFPDYDLVYTMTEEQKKECEEAFGVNMKILRKSGVPKATLLRYPHQPIRLIYAGGIYCGRVKTLCKIVQALRVINQNELKMQLHIYTGGTMTKKQQRLLNDQKNSFVHSLISLEALREKYEQSDIALHIEAFGLKNRLLTRLSFSTKIVDCLASGCAVLAIAWKEHSGLKYLKRENAAICVDDLRYVLPCLLELTKKEELIYEWRERAQNCLIKNHDRKEISQSVKRDFINVCKGQKYENCTN